MDIDQDVTFRAGYELLAGRFVMANVPQSIPEILFLHGAGKASKERCLPFANQLATVHKISSFTFDFSGHGSSTGTLENSSLKKRVEEAIAALSYAGFSEHVSLCGFSMGGHVALELVKLKTVRALILFYPGIYAREAYDIRFGDPRFTAILRRDQSWETADVFPVLNRFEGNVLIVAGENDQVVPRAVFQMLDANTIRANQKRLLMIPNAPHLLLPTILADEDLYTETCKTIADYIRDGVETRLASQSSYE